MTATPNGWLLDPVRLRQMNAVAALVSAAPYETKFNDHPWLCALPGQCTNKVAWAEEVLDDCGWPIDAMERWACDLPDGRRHAVLQLNIADMDGKVSEVIIDCRYPTPQIKADLNYTDWCQIGGNHA